MLCRTAGSRRLAGQMYMWLKLQWTVIIRRFRYMERVLLVLDLDKDKDDRVTAASRILPSASSFLDRLTRRDARIVSSYTTPLAYTW